MIDDSTTGIEGTGAASEDVSGLVAELLADPVLVRGLSVMASLRAGERPGPSGADFEAWRRYMELVRLDFCSLCLRVVMVWPDGMKQDWPERSLHNNDMMDCLREWGESFDGGERAREADSERVAALGIGVEGRE